MGQPGRPWSESERPFGKPDRVNRRNDHMDSLAAGLAVSEFAPDGTAAAEIRALWAWSKHKLTSAAPAEKSAPEQARAATATR
jgi:hypothetical protein